MSEDLWKTIDGLLWVASSAARKMHVSRLRGEGGSALHRCEFDALVNVRDSFQEARISLRQQPVRSTSGEAVLAVLRDIDAEVMLAAYGIDVNAPDDAPLDRALAQWWNEGRP